MTPNDYLSASTILPRVDATSTEELVRAVAEVMSAVCGIDREHIESAFSDVMRGQGFSLGAGVAIPHTEMKDLSATVVCLVTLEQPLTIKTVDGRPPDIFLFILSKPDPHGHLLLLAHLARLTQSRTFLEGLRRAQTPDAVMELVNAAELRYSTLQEPVAAATATSHSMFIVTIEGEKVVDAVLIALVDQGFGQSCILEAQSLREAAAHEVPLFAGFQDLFGDPGGRRILMLEGPSDRADAVIGIVRRVSEEYGAKDARVSVLPMQVQWVAPAAPVVKASGGH